jgi:hypothetical protein
MEDVEVGDIIGWRFKVWHDEPETEMLGEVVSIADDFLAIRSLQVNSKTCNPFHGRWRHHCHMVRKNNEHIAIAAE